MNGSPYVPEIKAHTIFDAPISAGVNLTTLAADFVPSPEQLRQIMAAEKFNRASDVPSMELTTPEICLKLYALEARIAILESRLDG